MSRLATIHFRDFSSETVMAGLQLEQIQQVVFDKFIKSLTPSSISKKEKFIFCNVGENHEVILSRNDVVSVLEFVLKKYEHLEDYNMCIKVRDIMKLLLDGKK